MSSHNTTKGSCKLWGGMLGFPWQIGKGILEHFSGKKKIGHDRLKSSEQCSPSPMHPLSDGLMHSHHQKRQVATYDSRELTEGDLALVGKKVGNVYFSCHYIERKNICPVAYLKIASLTQSNKLKKAR